MSSLGVPAGGVSHEFNNFQPSISGLAQLAQIAKKPEDVRHATEMTVEQAERAAQVTENLLRFPGSSKGTPHEEIDLKVLLDRSLMLVEKEAEKARTDGDLCAIEVEDNGPEHPSWPKACSHQTISI